MLFRRLNLKKCLMNSSIFNFGRLAQTKKIKESTPSKQSAFDQLIAWSEEHGAKVNGIKIKELSEGNRCLIATKDFYKGDVITGIPQKLIFSPKIDPEKGNELVMKKLDYDEEDAHYCALKLYIMTRMGKEEDFFKKYLDFLPKHFNNYPYFYDKTELALLKNSFFIEDLKTYFRADRKEFKLLCEMFPHIKENFTEKDYTVASILVGSRIFYLEVMQKPENMMVPISDMFNHDLEANAHWKFNLALGRFEIYALTSISAGKEIFLNYGEKSNSEYLLSYGFTIKGNENGERDMYYFSYLDEELQNILELTEKFKDLDYEFKVDYKGSKLLGNMEEFRKVTYFSLFNDLPPENIDFGKINDVDFELKVIKSLIKVFESIDKEYTTTAKQDRMRLKKVKAGTRQFDILNVLIEEKMMILNTRAHLLKVEERLQKLKRQENWSPEELEEIKEDDNLRKYFNEIVKF